MNPEFLYSAAASYWPAMVNRDRTRLVIVRKPRDWLEQEQNRRAREAAEARAGQPGVITLEIEPEQVGDYWMAYDVVRDTLYVWEEAEDE